MRTAMGDLTRLAPTLVDETGREGPEPGHRFPAGADRQATPRVL